MGQRRRAECQRKQFLRRQYAQIACRVGKDDALYWKFHEHLAAHAAGGACLRTVRDAGKRLKRALAACDSGRNRRALGTPP